MTGRARSYTADIKEKAAAALRTLPPKPPAERPMSTAEVLKQLKPEIAAAIGNGYTLQEVVEQLKKTGIKVGISTLKIALKGSRGKPKELDRGKQS